MYVYVSQKLSGISVNWLSLGWVIFLGSCNVLYFCLQQKQAEKPINTFSEIVISVEHFRRTHRKLLTASPLGRSLREVSTFTAYYWIQFALFTQCINGLLKTV